MHPSVDEIARLYRHYRDLDITPYVTHVSQKPHAFGGLANVHTAMWFMPYHERPQKVAVKLLRCASVPDERVIKRLRKEIGVWRRLEHANVQQLSGLRWSNSGLPAMVSIWHDNGDINTYITKIKPGLGAQALDETKLDLFADVARGLDYLHRNRVIHADIKGLQANVLVSADKTARLCDFGFSWILAGDALSFSDPSSTLKGTVRWMAPELVDDDAKHTKESDIWAYGCLMLEVQGECRPYYNKTNDLAVYVALGQKLQPSRPQTLQSDAVWALVLSCCTLDALQRPRADQLLVLCEALRRGQSAQPQPQSSIVGDKRHAQPMSVPSPSAQGVRAMKASGILGWEDVGMTFADDDETYDSSPWFGEVGHSASPNPPNVSHRSPSEQGVRAMKASGILGWEDVGMTFAEDDETYDSSPWFVKVGPSASLSPPNVSQRMFSAPAAVFSRLGRDADWDSIDIASANPAWRRVPGKGTSAHTAAVGGDGWELEEPPARPSWRRVPQKGPRARKSAADTAHANTEWRDTSPVWRHVSAKGPRLRAPSVGLGAYRMKSESPAQTGWRSFSTEAITGGRRVDAAAAEQYPGAWDIWQPTTTPSDEDTAPAPFPLLRPDADHEDYIPPPMLRRADDQEAPFRPAWRRGYPALRKKETSDGRIKVDWEDEI